MLLITWCVTTPVISVLSLRQVRCSMFFVGLIHSIANYISVVGIASEYLLSAPIYIGLATMKVYDSDEPYDIAIDHQPANCFYPLQISTFSFMNSKFSAVDKVFNQLCFDACKSDVSAISLKL